MTPAERYVTLVVGLIAIIGFLWRISYSMGGLVKEFRMHVKQSSEIHRDQEKRLREVEHQRRQGRWLWNPPPG